MGCNCLYNNNEFYWGLWPDIAIFINEHYKWFKSFLQIIGGVPTGQTIENIFAIIDSKGDLINIDERTSNGSSRKETNYNKKENPLNVLNMHSNKYGICLASEQINEKTNEIPSIPTILEKTKRNGCIITWKTLSTQTKNVEAVIDKHGDYVVPIKGNQGNFYDDLIVYFDEKTLETIKSGRLNASYLHQNEKTHSCYIEYEYFQTSDVSWYFKKGDWKGLKSIGMVRKTITKNNQATIENRYYISSLNVNINDFSNAIRNHWSVEKKLHWHLDFTFIQLKNKKALMNLQIVNKFTLGVLNKVKPFYKLSLIKIRKTITFNFETNFITMLCYLALC